MPKNERAESKDMYILNLGRYCQITLQFWDALKFRFVLSILLKSAI